MISNIYTIYDVKAEAYLTPFFLQNEAILKRTIMDTLSDDNHMFGKHPEDYIMYYVGEYDDQTGQIVSPETPTVLWKLIDLKGDSQ